ncbi:MAG: DUF1015 domain-containing protein [Bacteroidia bacterium]|nr:DUF1015 domain-containing protein [Bacteroidia bacterium]MDW8157497.1 DUF1015 domain-containing protein [Bacteroidia bacterium]
MAIIRPFSAWRYNSSLDIREVVVPLLDNIEQLQSYYDSPYNAIHLAFPRAIHEVGKKLEEWKRKQILVRDPLPAIYPYYQAYSLYGQPRIYERKGFICLIRLNEIGTTPQIIQHENTIKYGLAARQQILENTKMNFAPTHGLFEGDNFEIEELMDKYMQHPIIEVVDAQGVRNKLGIIQNQKEIVWIMEALENKRIYLADGHHRLEISELYRRKQSPQKFTDLANFHMMYLSNLKAGMDCILPTHRLIKLPDDFETSAFLEKMKVYFHIKIADKRLPLFQELQNQKYTFGIILPENRFIAKLKDNYNLEELIDLPLPSSVKRLDYTLLHYIIIDKILGIPYDEQPQSETISYNKEYAAALRYVENPSKHIAIIVNGVSLAEMLAVCKEGAIMPQKSTYFYPKVLNGLVFASIDNHEYNSPFEKYFNQLLEKKNTSKVNIS